MHRYGSWSQVFQTERGRFAKTAKEGNVSSWGQSQDWGCWNKQNGHAVQRTPNRITRTKPRILLFFLNVMLSGSRWSALPSLSTNLGRVWLGVCRKLQANDQATLYSLFPVWEVTQHRFWYFLKIKEQCLSIWILFVKTFFESTL